MGTFWSYDFSFMENNLFQEVQIVAYNSHLSNKAKGEVTRLSVSKVESLSPKLIAYSKCEWDLGQIDTPIQNSFLRMISERLTAK